ncbi:cytoplasmic protein [Rossellomorea vietnamensis]|uniref:Cytoplasmic protein n=1 Tax=Rossellomorea vietnamensis TaxID=218284 RepID=A0A5D4MEM8_9BACI|nr:S4 domain-containing protein [Rossellomorea vietnamensis]TYR99948.1 cytoplasmic protein [Rossellomorea vietnamensis]
MKTVCLKWQLIDAESELFIERHCSNCGRTVRFQDTLVRRHNANGKNIFRFAIYKCEKNHTWNRKLETYKSFSSHVKLYKELHDRQDEVKQDDIDKFISKGHSRVLIDIEDVHGVFRLDKLLSDRISLLSRTRSAELIREGSILVNDGIVKRSRRLNSGDKITMLLEEMF